MEGPHRPNNFDATTGLFPKSKGFPLGKARNPLSDAQPLLDFGQALVGLVHQFL